LFAMRRFIGIGRI